MSQPTKTETGVPSADETRPLDTRRSTARQDTVLLTTPLGTPAGGSTTSAPISAPTLSTASLSALSQRYDILGEAGHGNMGNVYKARDRETGETVALKLIKPEIASDQDMMERFKNELLFARKITHKNVCRVYEFNRIGGLACTSMEYVEGESLRSVLNRFGGLPVRKAVDIALQICSGLKEAHAQGIVHRDLKPENVMIDAQGNVKIMDFGIARSMEAGTRLTGSMVGTPAYMAPEQVAGKPVDYRTDIYSLGLMLYEMFTGTQAFRADTAVAVALKQMRESPVPPHEVDPSVPVGIERLILKCLEKEPARRFQSIAELEQGLRSPSATGTGSAAASASMTPLPPRNITTASRVTHTTHSTASVSAKPKSRRAAPLLWLLLGAFAVLAAFGANRAMRITKSANQVAPPVGLSTPNPPNNAFKEPAAPAVKHTPAKPATPPPPEVFPRVEYGRGKAPRQNSANMTSQRNPQRPGQQFNSQQGNGQNANEPAYLLVGRFGREDRAQGVSKRLEDMNLPVMVLPRKTPNGEAFFVLTGPYNGGRLQNVKRQLEEQGFLNVHPVRPGQMNQNRRQNQNPQY